MIKNDKQHAITKARRDEFSKSLEELKTVDNEDVLNRVMMDAIISQLETFDREIDEYEKLKNEKPKILSSSIERLPEILIKARIVQGLTQNDLAKKTGLKEQQIQRYESCNYESANFERIISIATSMGIRFEDAKASLNQDLMKVNGYDPIVILDATAKLQLRGTLLCV